MIVVDASNLQRNLYYATQVIELGYPTLLALNMIDVAETNGHRIDAEGLERELGIPVIPLVASTGVGLPEMRQQIISRLHGAFPEEVRQFCALPPELGKETSVLAGLLTSLSVVSCCSPLSRGAGDSRRSLALFSRAIAPPAAPAPC